MNNFISAPGFILHRYSYSETSLLLKVLMPDLSITPLIAKGVKNSRRGKLALAGLCEPFNYLNFSYSGRGDVKSLRGLELISPMRRLVGEILSSGFYLNELMIYLLGPAVCSEKLFEAYLEAQKGLASLDKNYDFLDLSKILRAFEYILLKETGHGPNLSMDQAHQDVCPLEFYEVQAGDLPLKIKSNNLNIKNNNSYLGEDLLKIDQGIFDSAELISKAKNIFRDLINLNTEGRLFKSREMLKDLRGLKNAG